MISWLQVLLQKHYKWLFTILLGIIVVAFVFTVGASPGIGSKKRQFAKQLYYGVNLNSDLQVRDYVTAANISSVLDTGQSFAFQSQLETAFLERVFLLHVANTFSIPEPTEVQLGHYIQTKGLFLDPKERFSKELYDNFIESIHENPQISEDFVRTVLVEDYRIDQVRNILKGPGFILPYEAQFDVEQTETLWSVNVATFDFDNFKVRLDITEEALNAYYERNKRNYKLPEQVSVAYIIFKAEDYQDTATVTDTDELRKFFDKNIGLFVEEDKELPTFEAIQDRVVKEYKLYHAKRAAAEKAYDFSYHIFENKIQKDSPAFQHLLAQYNLELTELPAYDAATLLPDSSLPSALLKQAFSLNEDNFVSDVIYVGNDSSMLILNEKLAANIPSLDTIRDEVMADLVLAEQKKHFISQSKGFHKDLEEALNNDISFEEAVAGTPLSLESFNSFKIKDTPEGLNPILYANIITMKQGELSPTIPTDSKVFYVYIRERNQPTLNPESEAVQKVFKSMVPMAAASTAYGIVIEMVAEGLQKSSQK